MTGLLARLLGGWRRVRIRGRHGERLISALADHGYRLWQVERHGDELFGLVTEEGYETLLTVARGTGYEVLSVRRGGLPFRWRQLRHRPCLFGGLATALIILWYATAHIWVISVSVPHLSAQEEMQLIHSAEVSGLRVGANRSHLNIPDVRRRMLQTLPQYSWIGIHTKGVVAEIDGVRIVRRPPDHLPPRLVAQVGGKVTAVFVYMGEPEVLVGESVKRGQTLIAGIVSSPLPVQPDHAKTPVEDSVTTPAEGEVMADVTLRVKIFQPFKEQRSRLTGRRYVERFVELDRANLVHIPNLHAEPFRHYDTRKKVMVVRVAGVLLPVRFIEIVYNETVIRTVPLRYQSALRRGQERALMAIRRDMPKDAKRVRQSEKVTRTPRGVWVTMTWVTNRNIAVPPRAVKH